MQSKLAGAAAELQEEWQPLGDFQAFRRGYYEAHLVPIDTLSIHTTLSLARAKRASVRYLWANERVVPNATGRTANPLTSGTNVNGGHAR
jgi:hypothetical protein